MKDTATGTSDRTLAEAVLDVGGDSAFATWLRRIGVNLAVDFLRGQGGPAGFANPEACLSTTAL